MNQDDSFQRAMARLRLGDEAEAAHLFRRFGTRLVHLAYLNMNERLRQKVDPEDVANSAFKSFFIRNANGQFNFGDWDDVWSMLVVIAVRKCGHQLERYSAARRDLSREQALAGPAADDDSFYGWEAVAAGPTPVQAVMLQETIDKLLAQFGSASEQQIAQLSLEGFSPREISAKTQRSERTVHRVRRNMRDWLEQQRDGTV